MSLIMARFNKLMVFAKQDLTDHKESVEMQDSGSGLEGFPHSGHQRRPWRKQNIIPITWLANQ